MIRSALPREKDAVLALAESTEFFSPDEFAWVSGILASCLNGELNDDHTWLVLSEDDAILATAYYAQDGAYEEPHFPDEAGMWNLYFIGVRPELKGHGHGGALLQHIEREVLAQGAHRLIIETSSLPSFKPTHGFYRKHGYHIHSQVPDAYGPGDDKIVFCKDLSAA